MGQEESLSPAQYQCIKKIILNLLSAPDEAKDKFSPKFFCKMVENFKNLRVDLRQEFKVEEQL